MPGAREVAQFFGGGAARGAAEHGRCRRRGPPRPPRRRARSWTRASRDGGARRRVLAVAAASRLPSHPRTHPRRARSQRAFPLRARSRALLVVRGKRAVTRLGVSSAKARADGHRHPGTRRRGGAWWPRQRAATIDGVAPGANPRRRRTPSGRRARGTADWRGALSGRAGGDCPTAGVASTITAAPSGESSLRPRACRPAGPPPRTRAAPPAITSTRPTARDVVPAAAGGGEPAAPPEMARRRRGAAATQGKSSSAGGARRHSVRNGR